MRQLLPIVLLALHCTAWAQTATLTEAEAIRRGLARPKSSDLDTAQVDIPRSNVLAAGVLPNPSIASIKYPTNTGPHRHRGRALLESIRTKPPRCLPVCR